MVGGDVVRAFYRTLPAPEYAAYYAALDDALQATLEPWAPGWWYRLYFRLVAAERPSHPPPRPRFAETPYTGRRGWPLTLPDRLAAGLRGSLWRASASPQAVASFKGCEGYRLA